MNNPMWNAILRWSITQQDPDGPSKDIKPMSDKDKKWLDKVMKSMVVDEIGRMKMIRQMLLIPEDPADLQEFATSEEFSKIMNPPTSDDEEENEEEEGEEGSTSKGDKGEQFPANAEELAALVLEKKKNCLDELEDLVLTIDRAQDLHKVEGLVPVVNTLQSRHPELRWRAASVLATATQNNPKVQGWATEAGAVAPLCLMLRHFLSLSTTPSPDDHKVAFKAAGALSCIIREQPVATIQFHQGKGLLLVAQLAVGSKSNDRTKSKCLFFLSSLVETLKSADFLAAVKIHKGLLRLLEHEDVNIREGALKVLVSMAESEKANAALVKEGAIDVLKGRSMALQALTDSEDIEMCEDELALVTELLGKL